MFLTEGRKVGPWGRVKEENVRVVSFIIAVVLAATAAHAANLQEAMLDAHNKERASLGLAPLTWNADLAAGAAAWAKHEADTGERGHSKLADRGNAGENIWVGTTGAFGYYEMIYGWLAEKPNFVDGVYPAVRKTNDAPLPGHYSQMVWRNTTQIGCGLATGGNSDILVCRYNPGGNKVGEKPY